MWIPQIRSDWTLTSINNHFNNATLTIFTLRPSAPVNLDGALAAGSTVNPRAIMVEKPILTIAEKSAVLVVVTKFVVMKDIVDTIGHSCSVFGFSAL